MIRFPPRLTGLLVLAAVTLAGCGMPTGPLGMPMTGGGPGSPLNDKNYPDPHPQSDSDAAQRAAYQANQQQQSVQQQMSMPDLSSMHCATISSGSTGTNAGSMTSSRSCHN
jgi:hypothetical protein